MSRDFDAFIDGMNYPVYVVTAANGEDVAGCLIGFASQVTIDPPRLLACLSVKNRTYRVAADAPMLAVHAMGGEQRGLAELFGSNTGDDVDKFARCRWKPGPCGVPLLLDCPRWLVGRVFNRVPFGDHVGFVLEPVAVQVGDQRPTLTFLDVLDLSPGHDA